jgi:hypothetical protein
MPERDICNVFNFNRVAIQSLFSLILVANDDDGGLPENSAAIDRYEYSNTNKHLKSPTQNIDK